MKLLSNALLNFLIVMFFCFNILLSQNELIVNGNFNLGNIGFTSDYIYTTTGLLDEGRYSLLRNPHDLHSSFANCSDHTTGSGLMMVVNGSGSANKIVWSQTVKNIVPNHEFKFSIWLCSVYFNRPAIINIWINEILINPTPINLSTTTCKWQSYTFRWTSNADTALIRIIDSNIALEGNDFAIDDISFKSECFLKADAGQDKGVCNGDTVSIGNEAKGGISPISYHWIPEYGLSSADTCCPKVTINTSMAYKVTATDRFGCQDSDSVIVEIYPIPDAEIKPVGSIEFCEGDSLVLKAYPIGSEYSYLWSTGESKSEITVKESGTFSLLVKNSHGCKDSAEISTTTYPLPNVKILGETSFCEGDSVKLSAIPNGAGYSYHWSNEATDSVITVKQSGIYSVVVENSFGCKDSNSVNVTANQKPDISIVTNGNTSFCKGDSILLIATPFVEEYTYKWSTGETSKEITVKESGTYTVIAENSSGCKDTASIPINVYSLPVFGIIPGNIISLCDGDSVVLSTDKEFESYQWSTGETNRSITIKRGGTYFVNVTDIHGCTNIDSTLVIVLTLPQPKIIPDTDTTICSCDSLILDAGGPYVSYLWSNGETSQIITVKNSGKYFVTVTDTNGCKNTSSPININVITPKAIINLDSKPSVARDGKTILIPLFISDAQNLDFCNVKNFIAKIGLSMSILVPLGNTPKGVIDKKTHRRTITLKGTRKTNDSILFILEFISTLGKDSITAIEIESFAWTDCPFSVGINNTYFTLDGICRAGNKARLLIEEPLSETLVVTPNPILNKFKITFYALEEDYVRLYIVDFLGRKVLKLYDGNSYIPDNISNKNKYVTKEINSFDLAAGIYYVIYENSKYRVSKLIEIEK